MKTVLNIKTDRDVKEQAQKIAAELGLSLSAIVNAHLKHFVRNRSVLFSLAPRMTAELEALVEGVEEDIRGQRNMSTPLQTPEELAEYLDAL